MKDILFGICLGLLAFVSYALYQGYTEVGIGTNEVVFQDELPPVGEEIPDGHNRTESNSLSAYAQEWADHMAARNTFNHSHVSTLAPKHGTVRENIAYIVGPTASWELAYRMWHESPPHAYNIANGGEYIGFASATNGHTTYYVVLYAEKP